jgi:hypothetical protein
VAQDDRNRKAASTPPDGSVDHAPPAFDPDDPRLEAFVEALACALLEDLQSNPQR